MKFTQLNWYIPCSPIFLGSINLHLRSGSWSRNRCIWFLSACATCMLESKLHTTEKAWEETLSLDATHCSWLPQEIQLAKRINGQCDMTETSPGHSHNWIVKACIKVPLPIFLYPICSQSSLNILRTIFCLRCSSPSSKILANSCSLWSDHEVHCQSEELKKRQLTTPQENNWGPGNIYGKVVSREENGNFSTLKNWAERSVR